MRWLAPVGKYTVTSAAHGTVIEVRYDPFDLSKAYRFENREIVETLLPAKLNAMQAERIPEETKKPQSEVSAASIAYFTKLRELHIQEQKNHMVPAYSRLIQDAAEQTGDTQK